MTPSDIGLLLVVAGILLIESSDGCLPTGVGLACLFVGCEQCAA